jgi:DNA replication protein DnaC
MAESNAYNSILQYYTQKQVDNDLLIRERRKEIRDALPEYKELDDLVADISVRKAQEALKGDKEALADLNETLDELATKKKLILVENGYSVNYLDPVFECQDCKDTGFINGEKCHCFKQKLLDQYYRQSNIKEELKDTSFDDIDFDCQFEDEDKQRLIKAYDLCRDFAEKFGETETKNNNILLYGNVGTGKTLLTNCVANEVLRKGYSCIYFSAINFFDVLSDNKFRNKDNDGSVILNDIYNCDLLIIDDLGTELTNSFIVSALFDCLNERYIRSKATIISTNIDFKDLREHYDDRIFSRITSNFSICKLTGTDVRIQLKRIGNK